MFLLLSIILEAWIIEGRRIRQRRAVRSQLEMFAAPVFFGVYQPILSAIISAAVIFLTAGLRLPEITVFALHGLTLLAAASAACSAAASGISKILIQFRHTPNLSALIVFTGFPHVGQTTCRRVLYVLRLIISVIFFTPSEKVSFHHAFKLIRIYIRYQLPKRR